MSVAFTYLNIKKIVIAKLVFYSLNLSVFTLSFGKLIFSSIVYHYAKVTERNVCSAVHLKVCLLM